MDEFESNTFGITNGQSGPDTTTTPTTSFKFGVGTFGLGTFGIGEGTLSRTDAPARDTVGNGYKLTKFRGDYMTPWYKDRILRRENSRRRTSRMNRSDRFMKSGMSTTIS